ncbi:MAG: hypothetical protein ACI9SG_002234, partial [Maribacter sp.]
SIFDRRLFLCSLDINAVITNHKHHYSTDDSSYAAWTEYS